MDNIFNINSNKFTRNLFRPKIEGNWKGEIIMQLGGAVATVLGVYTAVKLLD